MLNPTRLNAFRGTQGRGRTTRGGAGCAALPPGSATYSGWRRRGRSAAPPHPVDRGIPALGPWKIIEAGNQVLVYAQRRIDISTNGQPGNPGSSDAESRVIDAR